MTRGGKNILVMCETYKYNKEPTETNHRKVNKSNDFKTLREAEKKISLQGGDNRICPKTY